MHGKEQRPAGEQRQRAQDAISWGYMQFLNIPSPLSPHLLLSPFSFSLSYSRVTRYQTIERYKHLRRHWWAYI
jgi:hypothetical protein